MKEPKTFTIPRSPELSYAWDLVWDVKTKKAAQTKYAQLKAALTKIPQELAEMEQLAAKDGFSLE
jgi:hypothetical protein